jgi:hypothetical protein
LAGGNGGAVHRGNAFSPTYLARLRERDDSLTAAEAELAGPWKIEPVPGRPGAVAMLRIWEDLAVGDPPVGVLWHLETAQLLSVLLPAIDREPLFYLKEEPSSEGFPLVAVYGEQGPQVAGWLDRYEPRWADVPRLVVPGSEAKSRDRVPRYADSETKSAYRDSWSRDRNQSPETAFRDAWTLRRSPRTATRGPGIGIKVRGPRSVIRGL